MDTPSYKFEIVIQLDTADAGYSTPPLARIQIQETVPSDVEPVEYIEKRMNEEFKRKLGETVLQPAGLPKD